MDEKYEIKTYITPADNIVKSDEAESLGTSLSLVKSSHEPVFIFDRQKNFLGLISPHITLYKRHFPYLTKVKSGIYIPPKIDINTPLYDVVDFMLSVRIYTLPVFNAKKNIIGIINAKNIFKGIIKDKLFLSYVTKFIKLKSPVTAHMKSSVKEIYSLFRQKKISRVILVDDEGDLAGIVARSDIKYAFIDPVPRQRFSKNEGWFMKSAFDEEEVYRIDDPVKKFYKSMVFNLPDSLPLEETIRRLAESEYNSVVLVSWRGKPTGFISSRDILQAISQLNPDLHLHIPIVVNWLDELTDKLQVKKIKNMLEKFGQKFNKRRKISKLEVSFEKSKYPTGQIAEVNITVVVTPVTGKKFISKTKNRSVELGLRDAIKRIEEQERRMSDQKMHHSATPLESAFQ